MTLIVGIQCNDGIAVGADGAATYGGLGQHTIRQPAKKINVIQDRILVGTSGPVGLGQLIRQKIDEMYSNNEFSGRECPTPEAAMRELQRSIGGEVVPGIEHAKKVAPLIGQQGAASSALCWTLVALPVRGKPCLIQLDQQCAPELATEDLPFVALGSGQGIADPFLAFLRRVFWQDRIPSLADGVFAVAWTLHQAIATTPGFVADPRQVAVLQKEGQDWKAKILSEEELEEHNQQIEAAETYLRDFPEAGEIQPPPE